jgi:hypothetical protein
MRSRSFVRVYFGIVAAACAIGCGGTSAGGAADSSTPLHDGGPGTGDAHGMDVVTAHPDAADATAPDAVGPQDGSDASSLAALAACLGSSTKLTLSGDMPYVDVPVGTEKGEFVLDFATTFSSIDLTAFASPGPMTSGCDASELGETCTVADFAFFGPPASVELTTADFSGVGGTVRQAGLVATDILSEYVITLEYPAGLAFGSPQSGFCSDAALQAAGFVSLSTAGFYENDVSLLEPATDVDSNAATGLSVADVPTVKVQLAGVGALAQLDTGFEDVMPFAVNINQAYYAAIMAASPSALVRDTSLDTTLTTCVEDVSQPVMGYRVAAADTFDFMADGGGVARSFAITVLYVKQTPEAAESCGGIGTWTVPAAQVGASYFNAMQGIVFDPYGARVWIPKG